MKAELDVKVQQELLDAITAISSQNTFESPLFILIASSAATALGGFLNHIYNKQTIKESQLNSERLVKAELEAQQIGVIYQDKLAALKELNILKLNIAPVAISQPDIDHETYYTEVFRKLGGALNSFQRFYETHGSILSEELDNELRDIIHECSNNSFIARTFEEFDNYQETPNDIRAAENIDRTLSKAINNFKVELYITTKRES